MVALHLVEFEMSFADGAYPALFLVLLNPVCTGEQPRSLVDIWFTGIRVCPDWRGRDIGLGPIWVPIVFAPRIMGRSG